MGRSGPTVGVALVNWNACEFTISCIESLLSGRVIPNHIVVVDNGSKDDSVCQITRRFGGVIMVRKAENIGFAAATNEGIDILLQKNVDYIWILNNDTRVDTTCLSILLEMAKKHPAAAGFSGKVFVDSAERFIWYGGAVRNFFHLAPKHLLTECLDGAAVDGVVKVEFISGCCLFAPALILRQYGGFVPEYIAYSEDSEWCWRVTKAGGVLLYVPSAHLWHKVSASVRKNADGRSAEDRIPAYCLYLMIRNHLWTIRAREDRTIRRWIGLGTTVLVQAKNLVWYLVRHRPDLMRRAAHGIADGLIRPTPCSSCGPR